MHMNIHEHEHFDSHNISIIICEQQGRQREDGPLPQRQGKQSCKQLSVLPNGFEHIDPLINIASLCTEAAGTINSPPPQLALSVKVQLIGKMPPNRVSWPFPTPNSIRPPSSVKLRWESLHCATDHVCLSIVWRQAKFTVLTTYLHPLGRMLFSPLTNIFIYLIFFFSLRAGGSGLFCCFFSGKFV